jgi:hypothetical protein
MSTAILFGGAVVSEVHALTVSPVKIDIEADPGQTVGGVFELHNEEQVSRTLFVSYENFEPSGDFGTPRFVGSGEGLATWLQATEELTLGPDEREVIPFTITVPADTKPGGYFAAIFYGAQNPRAADDGEVAIGGKLGVLILLRVRGDIEEDGGINAFSAKDSERFFTQLPISFVTQMTNRGGDRIVPRGGITISNIIGMEADRIEVNPSEGSILPNSSRTFTTLWDSRYADEASGFFGAVEKQWSDKRIGAYRAEVELVWGEEDNVSKSTFWFIVFPWQLILTLIGVCLIAYTLLRAYNRMIIARARS